MKKLLIIITIFIFLYSCCNINNEKLYCGKVTEKYILHDNNGTIYNIVFNCKKLHKNINVVVSTNCYVNTKINESVCFNLTDYDLSK